MSSRIAICPGSFDPITNGHLDVVQPFSRLFDQVVVAVAASEAKRPLFTLQERLDLVRQSVRHLPNVEADAFTGLFVESRARSAHAGGARFGSRTLSSSSSSR